MKGTWDRDEMAVGAGTDEEGFITLTQDNYLEVLRSLGFPEPTLDDRVYFEPDDEDMIGCLSPLELRRRLGARPPRLLDLLHDLNGLLYGSRRGTAFARAFLTEALGSCPGEGCTPTGCVSLILRLAAYLEEDLVVPDTGLCLRFLTHNPALRQRVERDWPSIACWREDPRQGYRVLMHRLRVRATELEVASMDAGASAPQGCDPVFSLVED